MERLNLATREPLNLKKAAVLIGYSKHTLKEMLYNGEVRGHRPGKEYLFYKDELLEDIRKFNGKALSRNKLSGRRQWVSINDQIHPTGSYVLPLQAEDEYNALLKRRIKN